MEGALPGSRALRSPGTWDWVHSAVSRKYNPYLGLCHFLAGEHEEGILG